MSDSLNENEGRQGIDDNLSSRERTMSKLPKRWRIGLLMAGCLLLMALALPVSNLATGRTYVAVSSEDAKFQPISRLLQRSCADCHAPKLIRRPLYFSFPVASQLIAEDVKQAQTYWVITEEQLSGAEPLNAAQLAKLKRVVDDRSMPPLRYKAMHWNAGLGDEERKALLAWIDKVPGGYGPQPIPHENPFRPAPAKVALGERLYNEVRLSGNDTVTCATCHDLQRGGVDGRVVSQGIEGHQGPINAPTVFNAAFNLAQFWDGRAHDLQEQIAGPVLNPIEMGSNWKQVIGKLKAAPEYEKEFGAVYGGDVSSDTISDAIAEFEKTLLTPDSRFDKFLRGEEDALDEQERRGYSLFTANHCGACHTGVNLGSLTYEKMGLKGDYFQARGGKLTDADLGRFNVTKEETDRSKFKTPTLRNVSLTGPYFHDGSAKTLEEAVRTMAKFQLGVQLSDEDAASIVAFLKTLTGEYQGKPLAGERQADR